MQVLEHLSVIAGQYDAFLLDLWGCVHDGSALYPGAAACLEALHAQGKRVVFISNAPRRAAKAQAVLDHLGIDRALYDSVVTSGEVAHELCARREWSMGNLSDYYFIGPERDADVLAGLDYRRVSAVDEAEFLLNAGFGTEEQSGADFAEMLHETRAKNLPMLCLNPDMEVVKITGERYPCAGVIAAAYKELGGEVAYIGKPYGEVYAHALALLAPLPKSRVLAVGDGLNTDILGARNAGLASVLITGGLLHEEADVSAYLARQSVTPDYLMHSLSW